MSSPQAEKELTWTVNDEDVDHLVCECQLDDQDVPLENVIVTMCGRRQPEAMLADGEPEGITCPMCWTLSICPVCKE